MDPLKHDNQARLSRTDFQFSKALFCDWHDKHCAFDVMVHCRILMIVLVMMQFDGDELSSC